MTGRWLEVARDDLLTTRLVEQPLGDLLPHQVLLQVDRLGLTSNNVTYAVLGEQLGYWSFFPADQGWGRLPAWGFATVVAGDVGGLERGTRVFGYLPLGTHLLVQPGRVGRSSFTDTAPHRRDLPEPYNLYRRVDADPLYSPDTENLQAVLLPLFLTSFVLDDHLAQAAWFGAEQVVLTSASAKTTIGTAQLLGERAPRPSVVGMTSPGNVEFVAGLGCYDTVLGYPEVEQLDASRPTVLVDVAGDPSLRRRVHEHCADSLTHSLTIGMSHWDAARDVGVLPGPAPVLFFAPSQIGKRLAEWGPSGYQDRLGRAWTTLRDRAATWLEVSEVSGLASARRVYQDALASRIRPQQAYVVLPGS